MENVIKLPGGVYNFGSETEKSMFEITRDFLIWLGKDVNKIYKRYYEMSQTLVDSGIFDIIAHPDLITCHSLYPTVDMAPYYTTLCKSAVKNNVMIEMNTSKGNGINEQFLQIAKECGVSFSTGSDAHKPENVGKGILTVSNLICQK